MPSSSHLHTQIPVFPRRDQKAHIRRAPLDPNECSLEGVVKMKAARGKICAIPKKGVSAGQKTSSKTSVQLTASVHA